MVGCANRLGQQKGSGRQPAWTVCARPPSTSSSPASPAAHLGSRLGTHPTATPNPSAAAAAAGPAVRRPPAAPAAPAGLPAALPRPRRLGRVPAAGRQRLASPAGSALQAVAATGGCRLERNRPDHPGGSAPLWAHRWGRPLREAGDSVGEGFGTGRRRLHPSICEAPPAAVPSQHACWTNRQAFRHSQRSVQLCSTRPSALHWKKARKGRSCSSVTRHSGWASWNSRASLLSSSCTGREPYV